MRSFKDLIKEVHKKGICQQCGGCVSFCNSIEHHVIGFADPFQPPQYLHQDQCLKCGLCYLICPQTHQLEEELNEEYNFTNFEEMPMGFSYNIHSCQATDPDFLRHGTDGGVLNSILNYLLEKGEIDGAIVAKSVAPFVRESFIARNKEDLLEASGLTLDVSPQLDEIQKFHTYTRSLPKLKQFQFKKLAVVGTPCQLYTIRCMQNLGISPSENITLCLGLFCYENFLFDRDKIQEFEQEFELKFEEIEKLNIKEDMILSIKSKEAGSRDVHIPFKRLDPYMRPACRACEDFTNIYADISFGGLGSEEKYTTVISRSEKGRSIILKAENTGIINCKSLSYADKKKIKALIAQYSRSKVDRKKKFFDSL